MPLIGREKVDIAIDDLYEKANKEVRSVFIGGLVQIVQGTPVDEGRARNNWFLSEGFPSSSSTTNTSAGLGAIRQISSMPKRVFNKTIYYTNNLPYIGKLEYGGYPNPPKNKTGKTTGGFSKQVAPAGWVRITLRNMAKKIRSLS